MMRKVFALVLALVLMVGAVPAASAAFADVGDAQLAAKLELLKTLNIVGGYDDGTFRPDGRLTRAEVIKLTINLLGKESQALLYSEYTIFSDAPSGFWATGYINLAARELELVKGDGMGRFLPNNDIKYAEAVTIIMRSLGYSDADVGSRWPSGHMERAMSLGLTDGINRGVYDAISRAEAATLFYNALHCTRKDGGKLIDGLVGSPIENALVVGFTSGGSVKLDDGDIVEVKTEIGADVVGKRVNFSTDLKGAIIGYETLEQRREVIAVDYCDSEKITALDGLTYKIPDSVRIFSAALGFEGETTKYSAVRTSLNVGDGLEIVYDADGAIDFVILLDGGSVDAARIVGINATAANLLSQLGATTAAAIYKNGAPITAAELKQYDVATYNRATRVVSVCDFRLAGVYEFAFPNAVSPSRVTVQGNQFELTAGAAASFDGLKIGQSLTLLFAANGKVVRALDGWLGAGNPAGLYTGSAVEFIGGPSLSFSFNNVEAGELVRVAPDGTASRLRGQSVSGDLDLVAGTLGKGVLAPDCVFFERVGANSVMAPVARETLLFDNVAEENIAFAVYDAAGRADIVVLDDVTGDRYIYGEIVGTTRTINDSGFDIDRIYLTVKGAGGEQEYMYTKGNMPHTGWGGLAVDRENKVVAVCTLTKYSGMTRAHFDGADTLTIDGVAVPIADDAQIYIAATGKYMAGSDLREMIADARAFGTEFEAYLENAPDAGGKVRILVVK